MLRLLNFDMNVLSATFSSAAGLGLLDAATTNYGGLTVPEVLGFAFTVCLIVATLVRRELERVLKVSESFPEEIGKLRERLARIEGRLNLSEFEEEESGEATARRRRA